MATRRWRRTVAPRPRFGRAVRIGRWIGCQQALPAAVAHAFRHFDAAAHMTTQQQGLLDALAEGAWEFVGTEELHEWWADNVWCMRSVWSPRGRRFHLTFLVDPQLDRNRQREKGEGVWAVSASAGLPASREQAEGELLFSFGRGWAERLPRFISDVSRFRHEPDV